LGFDAATAFEDRRGSGLKKASEVGSTFLWVAQVTGIAIESAEVEAISSLYFLSSPAYSLFTG